MRTNPVKDIVIDQIDKHRAYQTQNIHVLRGQHVYSCYIPEIWQKIVEFSRVVTTKLSGAQESPLTSTNWTIRIIPKRTLTTVTHASTH